LPHSYNPAAGFIATANQKMIPDDYPYAVGFEWTEPTRFERIEELFDETKRAGRKLTVADMQAWQTDVVSLLARRLQRLLRAALFGRADTAPGELHRAAALLLDWDCALRADSPSAALYELWAAELRRAVTQRAAPLPARGVLPTWSLYQVVAELAQPGTAVFGSAADASRDSLLRDTLQSAYRRLAQLQGVDPERWSWGALHKAYFRHALDAAGDLASLFDRGPIERPGDGDVLQATKFAATSFDQESGASYREIFDLSDWDNSVAINVPGQSGQPGAKHFDDLLALWSTGRYFPLKFTRAAVDTVTRDVLILRP
jgi:penicillin G amidase